MVGDHKARRIQALRLMHQHVATIVVDVVCHDESSGIRVLGSFVQILDELGCLRARRSAHVKDFVMGLNVENDRRNHGHCLLATDTSGTSLGNQEVVQLVECLRATNVHARQLHLPCVFVGVPGKGEGLCNASIFAVARFQVCSSFQEIVEAFALDDIEQSLGFALVGGHPECGRQIRGHRLDETVPVFGWTDILGLKHEVNQLIHSLVDFPFECLIPCSIR